MRCTKALTISNIKGMTTIIELDDVVGIDAVLGCCLGATVVAMVDPLTPTISTGYYLSAPTSELGGVVDRGLLFGR
jgi:hypothetical protein